MTSKNYMLTFIKVIDVPSGNIELDKYVNEGMCEN